MIITLTGENQFAIRQNAAAIIDDFVKKYGPHAVERIDGENFEPSGLPSLLQGGSLFAPQRLVVLQKPSASKPLWEALADQLGEVPAETTLLIVEPTPDKRTRTYKLLKNKSDFKELAQPNDSELVRSLQTEAAKRGSELGVAEAKHLLQRTGRDQWRLTNEVAKLADYAQRITTQAIDELVEPSLEASAFELLDAAFAGNSQEVSSIIAALANQEDPYRLVGLLASQVHALALAAFGGNRSADAIAADAGVHQFMVRKSQPTAKKLGRVGVSRITEVVATCDFQLKSTGADPWRLIEVALQKIARTTANNKN